MRESEMSQMSLT